MNQTEAAAGERSEARGLASFLTEALRGIFRREALVPALLLLVILTASNIVILLNLPTAKGTVPPVPFMVSAFIRIAGLLVLAVGLLRIATASGRPRWLPDGAFWLYALTFGLGLAASAVARQLVGERTDLLGLLLSNLVVTVLLSPLVPWVVAIAVEKPLAWRPGRWVRRFGSWLLPLLFWTLLLVTPMAVLHASIDMWLIKGAGSWFWPAALFDGALSTLMALVGLGLNAAAYRRVARG